jgi:integrase
VFLISVTVKYAMLSHRGVPYQVYPRKDAKNLYYYKFTIDSYRPHKSTKKTTRKEAMEVACAAIDRVLDSVRLHTPVQGPQSPFMTEVVSEWLETRKTALKPSTVAQIGHFMKWLKAEFPTLKIDEISIPQMHGYLNALHARLKPATSYWRDILTRYNQFFNWCILTQKTTLNPTMGYPRPKVSELAVYEEVWEDQEFSVICAHVSVPDEFALRCMRYMGIYPQDYAYAEKQDFKMKDGVLTFFKKRGKNHLKFNQPLDGRIEADVKRIWYKKKNPTDRMFSEVEKGRAYLSWYYLFQKRVYKVWQHCGLGKHKKLGALRHTFVTECVERGVPEDVLLQWLGHSPGSTVYRRVYLHRKSTARYRYVETPTPNDRLHLHGKPCNKKSPPRLRETFYRTEG